MPDSPSPRLVIAGDGQERATLEACAAASAIAGGVTFAGLVERPEEIIGSFDLFALSSDTEQMPFSIIEAMAAGLPIVATDVGDLRRMVSAENLPFLVMPEDEAGFTAGLVRLARDPALRRRIGAANREKVQRDFDLRAMCNAYDALFTAMAAGPTSGRSRNKSLKVDLGMLVRRSSQQATKEEVAVRSEPPGR